MARVLSHISIVGIILMAVLNCQSTTQEAPHPEYQRFVGDIVFDTILDKKDFKVCNGEKNMLQYFNTGEGFKYKGEKPELVKKIKKNFKPVVGNENQNGFIRIRFVINCKGESGRYRILSSDFNYEPKEFDKAIVNQLMALVKELDGWETIAKNNQTLDYYMYLIFKIDNGRISEILP